MTPPRTTGQVLIVEADRETRDLLAGFLRANAYHGDEAADGEG